jgi:hypothetical protein
MPSCTQIDIRDIDSQSARNLEGLAKRLFVLTVLSVLMLSPFYLAVGRADAQPKLGFTNAFSLLSRADYGGCTGTSLGPKGLQVNFPQTLPYVKTICSYQMSRSVEMSDLRVTALFNYTADPNLRPSAAAGESDELSVWAGQPEYGYFKDVEWGLVSRIQNDYTSMFLQVGNGHEVLSFAEVPLQGVDGKFHTYDCVLSEKTLWVFSTLTLGCGVDGGAIRQLSWTGVAFNAPEDFGLIAKSMRVTGPGTSVSGTLTVTDAQYAP